jgi:hypothetical protein
MPARWKNSVDEVEFGVQACFAREIAAYAHARVDGHRAAE